MSSEQQQPVVARAISGDADAIASIYNEMAPKLRRYAGRRLGRQDAAEHVVQETFVKALGDLANRPPDLQLRAWLFQIARNEVTNVYREWGRAVSLDERCDPDKRFEHYVDRRAGVTGSLDASLVGEPLNMGSVAPDPADLYEETEGRDELAVRLSALLDELARGPDGPRLVTVLVRQAEGDTYEQIAVLLEVDAKQVKRLAERARLVARRLWEGAGCGDGENGHQ